MQLVDGWIRSSKRISRNWGRILDGSLSVTDGCIRSSWIAYQGFIKDSSRIRPGFVQDCFRFLDVAFQMDSFSSDPAGTDASVRHGKRSVQDSSPIPRDSFAGTDPSH